MKWLRFAILSALPLAAACATGVSIDRNNNDGDGGSSPTPDAGPGDAGTDAALPPDAMIPCSSASDCAPFNDVCNVGSCVNGLCEKQAANQYGSCDDGLFCTENDLCVDGACVGGTQVFCSSLDSCHLGVCDEDLDTCKNIAGNDGGQCDDGDLCTASGICSGGTCSKGPPKSCALFNSNCSVGVCDPAVGCKSQPVNDGSWCDNGDFTGCSQGQCQAGNCIGIPQNEGAFCDDGKFDPCSQGQCTAGTCVSNPVNDGQGCDDGFFCTINDVCTQGVCAGAPNPCAPPNNPCMVGVCDEFSWTCTSMPGNNGMACDDENFCTGGEACSNGQCVGGQPANEGVACDDANGCTAGTSCAGGTCTNPSSQILQCGSGDACCPAGCNLANDSDCLYWASGVQQNVDPATLAGWSLCFTGTYDQNFPTLPSILAQCDKAKLLMACRPVGAPTYTLVAMAPRLDVLFDCGQQQNCTKQSNGVGWYYSNSWSWGFAPGGQSVNRFSCDYNDGSQLFPELRMCWHTGNDSINSGYRCGSNDLNGGFNWERVVYEAD